jgi:tRNA U34 5-carboxymethylaminomethyl modifying GTPase MnmE/TrmE
LGLAAEELRLMGLAMGAITGQVSPDDLLGKILSHSFIGK